MSKSPRESIQSSREPRKSATLELIRAARRKEGDRERKEGRARKPSKLRGTPQSGRMLFPSDRASDCWGLDWPRLFSAQRNCRGIYRAALLPIGPPRFQVVGGPREAIELEETVRRDAT